MTESAIPLDAAAEALPILKLCVLMFAQFGNVIERKAATEDLVIYLPLLDIKSGPFGKRFRKKQ